MLLLLAACLCLQLSPVPAGEPPAADLEATFAELLLRLSGEDLKARSEAQQQWQKAFDELGAALDRNPGVALAYYYRGLAAGKLDRKDVLFNDLDRFVAMAPTAPEADYARQLLSSFG